MRLRRLWLATLLFVGVGCSHGPSVKSEQVVQLPSRARQQIAVAQQRLDAADRELIPAKAAVDQAKQLRTIGNRELDAAHARVDAAQRQIPLGTPFYSDNNLDEARRYNDVVERELMVANLQHQYADQLVALRKAEYDLKRHQRDLARADLEYTKFHELSAHGMASKLKENDFVAAHDQAATDVASARAKVADLTGRVETLRVAWVASADRARTASRSGAVVPPQTRIPSHPRIVNQPPAGAANEATSAPQSNFEPAPLANP